METNFNAFFAIKQAIFKKKLYDPNPIRSLRINPLRHMIDTLRYSFLELNCMDALLDRANEHGYISYTQEQIAYEIGCHVDTVVRTERKMIEDGLLVLQRNYRRATWGRISSYFKSHKVRKRLSVFLPALATVIFVGYKLLQTESRPDYDFLFARYGDRKIYNSDYINYLSNYINQSVSISSDIRTRGEPPSQKRRKVDLVIPKWVKEIQSVHFSLAGQVAVSMFSERIIKEADAKLLKSRKMITDRARYFFKICHELCREKNIQPDADFADALHEKMGTNDAMIMTLTGGKNPEANIKIPTAFKRPQPSKQPPPQSYYDNPFTEYYETLSLEERKKYDNDPPPVFPGEFGKITYYRHATPQELADRQAAFMRVPYPPHIEKVFPLGYAEHVFNRLRFIEIKEA